MTQSASGVATGALGAVSPAAAGSEAFGTLARLRRDAAVVGSIISVLDWDQETQQPAGGTAIRSDQLGYLSGVKHAKSTSSAMGDAIAACEADADLMADGWASANVRQARRDFDKATKLPGELVEEIARSRSTGMVAWRAAREASDFSMFAGALEKNVSLARKKAECYGVPEWGGELYDALMDDFEPEMTAERTAEIFGPLRVFTAELVERVLSRGTPVDADRVHVASPIADQKAFSAAVIRAMGYDFERGRMDEAAHPFCESMGPGDIRITNRYSETGWLDQLSSASHEAGHGMYEQGLPMEGFFGLPAAEAVSLGIHESQSRMWENQVGRSRAFWDWAIGVARETIGGPVEGIGAEEAFRAANVIEPSFIRVEADEVTYNLHVMLRFDLERALIAGDLKVADLPGVWNERMKKDLGLDVPDDRRGCLQDIHWSMGAIGYFATYTLGNLYAAQLWEAMERDLPDREGMIRRGEFAGILGWLREKVHAHGRGYSAEELCERATGAKLSSEPLMRHLEAKAAAVYGV